MNTLIILISVFLNGTAQILLRLGMPSINMNNSYLRIFGDVITNHFVLLGLLSYGISIVLWLFVLSKVPVSYAYPFLSLGFVYVIITGIFWMGETYNIYKIIGTLLIVLGVVFIYKFGK